MAKRSPKKNSHIDNRTNNEGDGLRARKRRQTYEALLESATTLFTKHGVDGASMDAIAAGANVSVASLYNYFQSKDVLLAEIIERGILDFVETTEPLYKRTYKTPKDGYIALTDANFQWFDKVDRSWLRRFTAHALLRVDIAELRHTDIESVLQTQVLRMTQHLIECGCLDADVNASAVSKVVWSLANSEYYAYLSEDQSTTKTVCRAMKIHLGLFF